MVRVSRHMDDADCPPCLYLLHSRIAPVGVLPLQDGPDDLPKARIGFPVSVTPTGLAAGGCGTNRKASPTAAALRGNNYLPLAWMRTGLIVTTTRLSPGLSMLRRSLPYLAPTWSANA